MNAYYNDVEPFVVNWLTNLSAANKIAPGVVDGRSIEDVTAAELRGYAQVHTFAGIGGWSAAIRRAGVPDDFPVWTGSCPCFEAGTLILAKRGLLPIEDVVVGDLVMTHRNRWRRVSALMRSSKPTVIVKGQGHWGIATTDEHPFLSGTNTWTKAADLKGKRWACAVDVPEQEIPTLPRKTWRGKSQSPSLENLSTWRLIGYWLGNGWTRDRSDVVICARRDRMSRLNKLANDADLTGSGSVEPTAAKLRIGSKLFAQWLDEHFGAYAPTKRIPTWLLGAPLAIVEAFIDGLFFADGHVEQPSRGSQTKRLTTTSRQIAIGVRILLNRLGDSASIGIHNQNKPTTVIQGRTVNARPWYRVTRYQTSRSFKLENGYGWGLVRSIKPTGRTADVFNIAVDEDESYVADGIVVHNCQPFSGAGQREGVRDPRHLWPAWFALIQECRPGLIFGEQVASTDGLAWLDLVYADLERCGYTVGATDICAAGVGAPHNRSRLYFVAYTDEARRAIVGAPWLHDLRAPGHDVTRCGPTRVMGDAGRDRDQQLARVIPRDEGAIGTHSAYASFAPSEADVVADAARTQRTREEWDELQPPRRVRSSDGHGTYWSDAEWLYCTDEVYRPVEPGTSPLAPSRRGRVGRLRGYGNSINIEVATEFICASLEAIAQT